MANTVRKVAFLSAALTLLLSAQSYAFTGVTKEGFMFCMTESLLMDLSSFMAEMDDKSIREYVADKSCAQLKGGISVTVVRSSGYFDTRLELEYKGIRIWTFREAVKIDESTEK